MYRQNVLQKLFFQVIKCDTSTNSDLNIIRTYEYVSTIPVHEYVRLISFSLLHCKLRVRLDVDCENTYFIISDKPSCYSEVVFLTKINSWKIFTCKPPVFKYGLNFLILLCLVPQRSVITSVSGWIEASHYWLSILKPIIKIMYLKIMSTRRAEATVFSGKDSMCLPDNTASCARGQSLSYFIKTYWISMVMWAGYGSSGKLT